MLSFQDPSKGPPKGMAEALRFDEAHLEVLRLELPLLLLNFIREQSSKILQVKLFPIQSNSVTTITVITNSRL